MTSLENPMDAAKDRTYNATLAAFAILIGLAAVLWVMGRTPVCTCGTIKFWHGQVMSAETPSI